MTLTAKQQETLRAAIQDGLPLTARPYTTLAQQIMFSLAKPDYRALFFTVLG